MKKIKEIGVLPVYLIVMGFLIDFDLELIIDLKMMLVMAGCITLLYLSSYKKENIDRVRLFGLQTLLTAVLSSSLLFLKMLSLGDYNFEPTRPFFYGILYFTLFKIVFDLTDKPEKKCLNFESYQLTPREVMLAELLLKDKTNKQIASTLFIAESTVKKHLQNIYRKTNTTDRHDFIKKMTKPS